MVSKNATGDINLNFPDNDCNKRQECGMFNKNIQNLFSVGEGNLYIQGKNHQATPILPKIKTKSL